MVIGELVETLIRLRDRHKGELYRYEDEAICEACNLMARLPAQKEATTYEPVKD